MPGHPASFGLSETASEQGAGAVPFVRHEHPDDQPVQRPEGAVTDALSVGAPGASLVLDGQRSDTPLNHAVPRWCEKGPEHLRLATNEGFYRPRCKRRDCARCWAIRSRQTARVLVLDARENAPGFCATLTTHDPATPPAAVRRGTEAVIRRLRRRFGSVEYFASVEFTTGRAARSGGHRRLHLHLLLKAPMLDVIEAEQLVRESWSASTGAVVVEVAQLVSPGAALGYLALHHRKPEQAPPVEWRGMTERPSRGYFARPIAELRTQAQAELAAEAEAWRTGLPLEVAALNVAYREPGRLIEVRQLADLDVLEPLGEVGSSPRRGWIQRGGRLVHSETGELW